MLAFLNLIALNQAFGATLTLDLTASPAKLNFGKVDATASSSTKTLTLHNKGTAAAVISQLSPPVSFIISSDTCSNQTIQPKDECSVEVAFAPATVVGSVSETLAIPYNGTSLSETLEGDGIAITLKAPSSKTLPGVGAGAIGKAESITISNKSAAAVQLGAASAIPDFMITADECANGSLAPKASCVVTVAFAPATGTSGELSSTLSYDFTYGANNGNVAVTLKGKVTGQPRITLNKPAAGATHLSGHAYNVNPTTTKVVIYVLTNEWYVQPLADAPFTNISANGSWASSTNPWQSIVVLLVNPANYTPAATEITNPALDPGVIAWTEYPSAPVSVDFSGRTWGIKVTGTAAGDQFDPGPNFWSSNPAVVSVASDGLHLNITQINGEWQCGEVYLLQSLGYGTYTVQISSHLDQLDQNTVAAPLFIYAAPGQELDNEYSGAGGLIPAPYNAQFVVQPYTIPGNIVQYVQPSTAQFTSQMVWSANQVTFSAWNGWSSVPAAGDIIYQWTYTDTAYIPVPGQERVHINLWLLNGSAPLSGVGDQMVINSFSFQP
jgi:hypothetical protein